MVLIRRKKKTAFGEAFLGKDAYEVVDVPVEGEKPITEKKIKQLGSGLKPPTKGHDKPFDYRLWNTLRRKGRVGKK